MGEVYRARDTRLDRTVAIKVLPPGMASQPDVRERFEREARAIAALNHPHICVLHDIGHEDGIDFLVMEHVAGESLADRLKKGPLPLNQVLQYGAEIADALDRAHRDGIIHRDLKPANVMLASLAPGSGGTRVKLLDFGLAKLKPGAVAAAGMSEARTIQRDLTGHGSIVGTLHYMAPEQLEGREADARSDIFALGAALYEMATGRKAFDGKSQVSVISAILEHDPTPLRTVQPLTPPAFEHLVTTCVAKSPDDRWQTAGDVAKQLKWIAAGGGTQGVTAPAAPGRRQWVAWTAAAIVSVVLLAGGFLAARFARTNEPRQVMRFEVLTPSVDNPFVLAMMALSPDGRSLAFVAVEPGTSTQVLWVRRIDAVEAQKLPGTEGATWPFWSPDSRHIGFAAQGRLKRIDVSGGPPQTVCDVPPIFAGGTWNADGVIVFGGLTGLMRVSAAGGQPGVLTMLDSGAGETAHAWPTFLPDGRHLLFLSVTAVGGQPRSIKATALDSPQPQSVLAANSNPLYSPSGHLLFQREGTLLVQRFDAATLAISGEPVRIADGLSFNPQFGNGAVSVSDAGILATRSGAAFEPTRLTWFDRQGVRHGVVGEPAVYRGLGLSPDGQYLAVHIHQEPAGGDVWVMDLQRGGSTRYTFNAHNFAPSWSRDGKYVMFSSDKEGGLNLYRKPAGAAGGDEMMLGSGTAAFVEDLTPDGAWMVYGALTPKNGIDILRVPLTEKGEPQPVVSTAFFDGLAKISPDGRWIAYESDESGRREIYARPYPTGTAKWQISTDGGRYVRWSPKGGEILYLKDDGTLMAAEVRVLGDALVANTPRPLFKANPLLANHRGSALDIPYDVTRDGQRFIVNERMATGAAQSPISVVVNWTALLAK
jgi:Tol biopolymer transport system component